jgi:Rrf2 family protein
MFSKSCEYAIRALICISLHSKNNEKVNMKIVAESINAPLPFINKILQKLVKDDLLMSRKGPNGGFFITEEIRKKSILDIVKCIDGNSLINDCVMGLKRCNEKTPCPLHFQYKSIKANLIELFDKSTIEDMKEKIGSCNYFLNIEHSQTD